MYFHLIYLGVISSWFYLSACFLCLPVCLSVCLFQHYIRHTIHATTSLQFQHQWKILKRQISYAWNWFQKTNHSGCNDFSLFHILRNSYAMEMMLIGDIAPIIAIHLLLKWLSNNWIKFYTVLNYISIWDVFCV